MCSEIEVQSIHGSTVGIYHFSFDWAILLALGRVLRILFFPVLKMLMGFLSASEEERQPRRKVCGSGIILGREREG